MKRSDRRPFWEERPLHRLSEEEWESLCDRCGLCCLHKLEDSDSGEVWYTRAACRLLDLEACRCSRYEHRSRIIPDCITLTPENLPQQDWLPPSCAYRRLYLGLALPSWHPLLTGRSESVREAGISACHFAIPEEPGMDLEAELLDWPAVCRRTRQDGAS